MDHIERRDKQMLYISDDAVFQEQIIARKKVQALNAADPSDFAELARLAKELLPNVQNPFINPPFHCDYGTHIYSKGSVFFNYNGVVLDVSKVTIGDNFQAGPNVAIYGASHPLHPATRNTAFELGPEVVIGDNVWLGGNVVVCGGVHIGDNVVIGAGSVVTKDIPAWSFAAGNPARVIRRITEEDREYYGHHIPVDAEALEMMRKIWAENPDNPTFPTAPEA